MEIHNRIKSLRINNNLTQRDLGQKVGVSGTSVQCWENGTKIPSISAVISLSEVFNVSADYILGITGVKDSDDFLLTKQEKYILQSYRKMDRYGKKLIESVCDVENDRISIPKQDKKPCRHIPLYLLPSAAGISIPIDNSEYEMIPVDKDVPYNADFAVRIQGNSMYPYIHDGDIVYAERDSELSIGDVGIFAIDGAMYCKQYYVDDERNLTLVSANEAYRHTNIHIDADSNSEVRCYGRVLLGRRIALPDYMTDIDN